MKLAVLIFDGFELLDVFGPLEMFGMLPEHFSIHLIAEDNSVIKSAQGPRSMADELFNDQAYYDLLLVPGGPGTRIQINNPVLLNWIRQQSEHAKFISSVCTGSALLAKAGVLDGKKATTNKLAFDWVQQQSTNVEWIKQARWVEDGRFFTSSGVSAGNDMALALIEHLLDHELAEKVALWAEYQRNNDSRNDPFAIVD